MAVHGKIDSCGVLYIERAGILTEQICPHGEMKNCGHHCPLFGEPFINRDGRWSVMLCGRVFVIFDGFLDERRIPNNGEQDEDDDYGDDDDDPFCPFENL